MSWQIARHQVTIAGRVADALSGKPLSGVEVAISEKPAPFKKKLEIAAIQYAGRWAGMPERPDRTRTRNDGLFYFLDLPDGRYGLSAAFPGSGNRYGKAEATATVARDAKDDMKIDFVNFVLNQTAVKGKITGPGHKAAVTMAEVRVKGSGERAFSDAHGEYVLAGLEPGKRTLLVFAQGFRAVSQVVTLSEPGESQTVNFNLVRETG